MKQKRGEETNNWDSLTEPQNVTIHGLEFIMTSWGCPEQYDVLSAGRQVGYVRLRHGFLSVEAPDVEGKLVLSHEFDDCLLGQFESSRQRWGWLYQAALALAIEAQVLEGAPAE